MEIAMIGLGRMGGNLAKNMTDNGVKVKGWSPSNREVEGVEGKKTIKELVESLSAPRTVWVMVPAGKPTDDVLEELKDLLDKNDTLIEAGNSNYEETKIRAKTFESMGINFIDAGVSGGTDGARYGASTMVGGREAAIKPYEDLFKAVSKEGGYGHMGSHGAGHFVKMVHNGIEYGMMQALAEGYALLDASEYDLDYTTVSKTWSNGSIIESFLLDTIQSAFENSNTLDDIKPIVDFSGEGEWTVENAVKLKVSTPVIAAALFARFKTKDDNQFAERVLAAMRGEFGGHKVHKK